MTYSPTAWNYCLRSISAAIDSSGRHKHRWSSVVMILGLLSWNQVLSAIKAFKLEIWLQKVFVHLIVKLPFDLLCKLLMHDGVLRVKLCEYHELKAPEYVLLLEFQLLLHLKNLLLIQYNRIKIVLVNELPTCFDGLSCRPHWRLLCCKLFFTLPWSDDVSNGLEKSSLPDHLDIKSILHLLEVIARVLHGDLCALLICQIKVVQILEEGAPDPKPLVGGHNDELRNP